MTPAANDIIVSVSLLGVGVYFTLQGARLLLRLIRFRKTNARELLTWPPRKLPLRNFYRGLGIVSAVLALYNGLSRDRIHLVGGQAAMAAFFLGLMPVLSRVRPGFYEHGVWTENEFLPYDRIGRWAFLEQSEIVLLLLPRGKTRPLRLLVPPSEYGAARKALHANVREPEARILGI
ncbi:MAG: hypothetical protein JXO72_13465 [Vicinamibacteria bacterium]|nr:hypothetical protein [Vicinamibacteria bacterium]